MTGRILTYEGSQDGIRFGSIFVGGQTRSYHYDRLNGIVRLYSRLPFAEQPVTDERPWLVSEALRLLKEREPGEDALLDHCREGDS